MYLPKAMLFITLVLEMMLVMAVKGKTFNGTLDIQEGFRQSFIQSDWQDYGIIASFTVTFPAIMCCPIIIFYHESQSNGYGMGEKCFSESIIENNRFIDKQFFILDDANYYQHCPRNDDSGIHCSGGLDLSTGLSEKYSVAIGFRCDEVKQVQGFSYNISLEPLGDKINIYPFNTGRESEKICKEHYNYYVTPNIFGLTRLETETYFMLSLKAVVKSGCYKNAEKLVCSLLYPNSMEFPHSYPCREAYYDFIHGCAEIGLVIYKGHSLAEHDGTGCIDMQVSCGEPQDMPPHVNQPDVLPDAPPCTEFLYTCVFGYHMTTANPIRFCDYSGQWVDKNDVSHNCLKDRPKLGFTNEGSQVRKCTNKEIKCELSHWVFVISFLGPVILIAVFISCICFCRKRARELMERDQKNTKDYHTRILGSTTTHIRAYEAVQVPDNRQAHLVHPHGHGSEAAKHVGT